MNEKPEHLDRPTSPEEGSVDKNRGTPVPFAIRLISGAVVIMVMKAVTSIVTMRQENAELIKQSEIDKIFANERSDLHAEIAILNKAIEMSEVAKPTPGGDQFFEVAKYTRVPWVRERYQKEGGALMKLNADMVVDTQPDPKSRDQISGFSGNYRFENKGNGVFVDTFSQKIYIQRKHPGIGEVYNGKIISYGGMRKGQYTFLSTAVLFNLSPMGADLSKKSHVLIAGPAEMITDPETVSEFNAVVKKLEQ